MRYDTCESCGGFRLKDEALSVKIDKLHIGEVSAFTIENTIDWFKKLETKLNKTQFEIARRILKEIFRLDFELLEYKDLVFIVNKKILDLDFNRIRKELSKVRKYIFNEKIDSVFVDNAN